METSLAGKTFFVCYKQAGLVTVLAEADISLFALSTYDTDYVLVKSKPLSRALKVLPVPKKRVCLLIRQVGKKGEVLFNCQCHQIYRHYHSHKYSRQYDHHKY